MISSHRFITLICEREDIRLQAGGFITNIMDKIIGQTSTYQCQWKIQYSFLGLVSFLGDAYCLGCGLIHNSFLLWIYIGDNGGLSGSKKVLSCNFGHLQHYSVKSISTIEAPHSQSNKSHTQWQYPHCFALYRFISQLWEILLYRINLDGIVFHVGFENM